MTSILSENWVYNLVLLSNSHFETNFVISSTEGAGNNKIGFLKALGLTQNPNCSHPPTPSPKTGEGE